jgi:deoxyribodipyrimidine photolyase-related protein
MHRHRDFFGQNPRIGMLLKTLDRMDPDKRNQHFSESEIYLQRLDL